MPIRQLKTESVKPLAICMLTCGSTTSSWECSQLRSMTKPTMPRKSRDGAAKCGKKIPVIAPFSVIWYQACMGAVDYMDKVISQLGIKMRKNKQRWQRSVWDWLVSVSIHNSKIVMEWLLPAPVIKYFKKLHYRFGYFHWLQHSLGVQIVDIGLKLRQKKKNFETKHAG